MKTVAKSFLLFISMVSCLQLAAGPSQGKITKYFTNLGSNAVTVILETATAENGKYKIDKTVEKDLSPGAKNVAISIPGKELYQIEFTLITKQHPDKIFNEGNRINRSNYFMIDDDMMVEMQNSPFD